MEPALSQQAHRPQSHTGFPSEALRRFHSLACRWAALACQPGRLPCTCFHDAPPTSASCYTVCLMDWPPRPVYALSCKKGRASPFMISAMRNALPSNHVMDVLTLWPRLLLISREKIYVKEQSIEYFFKGKSFHNFVRMHPNFPTGKQATWLLHWMSGLKWKKS